jgi:hypothetical protein
MTPYRKIDRRLNMIHSQMIEAGRVGLERGSGRGNARGIIYR